MRWWRSCRGDAGLMKEERRGWHLAAGVAEKREGEIWVALVFLEGPVVGGEGLRAQSGLAQTRCEIALERGVAGTWGAGGCHG